MAVSLALAGAIAATSAAPATAASPIVVTRDGGDLPARCDVRKTAAAVLAFFDGFGSGGLTKEVERYAPAPAFKWFSSSSWMHKTVRHPVTLRRYLKERRAQRERLRLRMIQVSQYDAERKLVHFQPQFTRTARDQPAGFDWIGGGKGALRCRDRRLVVLSLAQGPQMAIIGPPCPSPEPGTAPENAVLACVPELD